MAAVMEPNTAMAGTASSRHGTHPSGVTGEQAGPTVVITLAAYYSAWPEPDVPMAVHGVSIPGFACPPPAPGTGPAPRADMRPKEEA
jgi:hypothetical protein